MRRWRVLERVITVKNRPSGAHLTSGGGIILDDRDMLAHRLSDANDRLMRLPGVVGTALGSSPDAGLPVIELFLAEDKYCEKAARRASALLKGSPVRCVVTGAFRAS